MKWYLSLNTQAETVESGVKRLEDRTVQQEHALYDTGVTKSWHTASPLHCAGFQLEMNKAPEARTALSFPPRAGQSKVLALILYADSCTAVGYPT